MSDTLRTRIAAAIGRNDCKDYHGTTDGSTCVFCVDWFLPKADAVIRELDGEFLDFALWLSEELMGKPMTRIDLKSCLQEWKETDR